METLEPWARLPAEGFQFHESTRMDIWPSDSYNVATRVLATASSFATLARSSYKAFFAVAVTEYRNPNSPAPTNNSEDALIGGKSESGEDTGSGENASGHVVRIGWPYIHAGTLVELEALGGETSPRL